MAVATKLQKVRGGLAAMADATPPDRDRYVDFLRAFSIGVVVFGHWLMAIVFQGPNGLTGANALDVIPGIWILTWVLQVMPLFFFVGGFSNRGSWKSAQRDGKSYGEFIQARIERLMRPTIVFITVWVAVALAIQVAAPQLMTSLGVAMELIAEAALVPCRLRPRHGSRPGDGEASRPLREQGAGRDGGRGRPHRRRKDRLPARGSRVSELRARVAVRSPARLLLLRREPPSPGPPLRRRHGR